MSKESTASFKYKDMRNGRFYILQRAIMKLDQAMNGPYRISIGLDPAKELVLITAKTD